MSIFYQTNFEYKGWIGLSLIWMGERYRFTIWKDGKERWVIYADAVEECESRARTYIDNIG